MWLILGLYNYWWCIVSFVYSLERKKSQMFFVASVIKFSVFSELPWKSILLVHYKLSRFQPPRTKQFDICALLFHVYSRFIILDKIVYIDNGNLPSGISSMSQLALVFFHLVMDSYCSLFNYLFGINIIAFAAMCIYIITLVAETT